MILSRVTALTEKLLLFGGAIQLAGEVRARGERRRVRSDWMAVERERGISVSSAVMSFEHEGLAFNLLDTPGHQDFSEDTYRTLTAVAMLNAIDNDHPKIARFVQSYSTMVSFSRAAGQLRCRLRSLTMRARSGA